jgi:hypothetical protein
VASFRVLVDLRTHHGRDFPEIDSLAVQKALREGRIRIEVEGLHLPIRLAGNPPGSFGAVTGVRVDLEGVIVREDASKNLEDDRQLRESHAKYQDLLPAAEPLLLTDKRTEQEPTQAPAPLPRIRYLTQSEQCVDCEVSTRVLVEGTDCCLSCITEERREKGYQDDQWMCCRCGRQGVAQYRESMLCISCVEEDLAKLRDTAEQPSKKTKKLKVKEIVRTSDLEVGSPVMLRSGEGPIMKLVCFSHRSLRLDDYGWSLDGTVIRCSWTDEDGVEHEEEFPREEMVMGMGKWAK